MLRKLQNQRILLVALLVLTMFGFCAQSLTSASKSKCNCEAGSSAANDVLVDTVSCCSTQSSERSSKCCCNPDAQVCECGDCDCGEAEVPNWPGPAVPAIPANERNEVTSPTLICAAPNVDFSRDGELKEVGCDLSVVCSARTAQQTCILLSRFTC